MVSGLGLDFTTGFFAVLILASILAQSPRQGHCHTGFFSGNTGGTEGRSAGANWTISQPNRRRRLTQCGPRKVDLGFNGGTRALLVDVHSSKSSKNLYSRQQNQINRMSFSWICGSQEQFLSPFRPKNLTVVYVCQITAQKYKCPTPKPQIIQCLSLCCRAQSNRTFAHAWSLHSVLWIHWGEDTAPVRTNLAWMSLCMHHRFLPSQIVNACMSIASHRGGTTQRKCEGSGTRMTDFPSALRVTPRSHLRQSFVREIHSLPLLPLFSETFHTHCVLPRRIPISRK